MIGCTLVSNSYFIYQNNYLNKQVKYLEQENERLKETPEFYWQNAIERFNNKNYTETKEILNKLIEKFPTSNLVKNSKEKIKEINLIEKKKKEEEQKIIKSLPKQIANAKNVVTAEKILDDLDNKYDTSYSELKKVIKNEREKVREKEAKRIIQSLPQKVKNSKSALDAETMLDNIEYKYGVYPGVKETIAKEKTKLKERREREIEEQKYIDRAEKIINAIQNKKFEIINGDVTMHGVVINTIGKPLQVFEGGQQIALLYEKTVRPGNLAAKQFNTVPFLVFVDKMDYSQVNTFIYEQVFEYHVERLQIYSFGKKYNSKRKKFI